MSSGAPVPASKLDQFKRPPAPTLNARPGASSQSPASRSPVPENGPEVAAPDLHDDDDEVEVKIEGLKYRYRPDQMRRIADTMDPADEVRFLTSAIREWGAKLWPEGQNRPEKMWTREGMFSDKERVAKDRKLSNMVLGILGRVTPENYDAMRAELVALPIRQSTDAEITDVVGLMYNTAVRPEHAPFTEIYSHLMADLVQHTGAQGVGKTIRKAIIDKCQQQFEKPFIVPDEERIDANGNPLPEEDIQAKTMQLKDRLRCNIKFLGHLFLCGMVNDKVVNYVLFHLLYGKDDPNRPSSHQKRRPEEYEVEMFCDLLKKVGKSLPAKIQQEYLPGYMRSLENLRPKVSNRIRFLLMDVDELWKNGWVARAKHGEISGPMKLSDFEKRDAEMRQREQQELERLASQPIRSRNSGPTSPKTPAPVKEQVPLPPKDSVYEVMERFKNEGAPAVMETFFSPIPYAERLPYFVHWLFRIVRVAKKEDERRKVGEVVDTMVGSAILKIEEVEKGFAQLTERIIEEQIFDDLPKLFVWWADMINSCKRYPSQMAHTALLRRLIKGGADRVPKKDIVNMTIAVLDAPDTHAAGRDVLRRFRPLPAVLTYSAPLPNPSLQEDEIDEEDEDTGDDLLLEILAARGDKKEPELSVFDSLTSGREGELLSYIQSSDVRTEAHFPAKVLSAIFTFVRCDTTGKTINGLKESIAALFKAAPQSIPILLADIYLTHRENGRAPARACIRFFDKLREWELFKPADLAAAWVQHLKQFDSSMEADFSQATGYVNAVAKQQDRPALAPQANGGRGRGR